MTSTSSNVLGTAGYEQIQALIKGMATYEGREISLPDIDRFAVERDVVAVTSAAVALISESMKAQLDRVQGLNILENLFGSLSDQGLIDPSAENGLSANEVIATVLYELMFKTFKQLPGANDETLTNGMLGTLNGIAWYLTDSEEWEDAEARSTSGDGVWAEEGTDNDEVIDLAYLDTQALYNRIEEAYGWQYLEKAGITPISSESTLSEIISTIESIDKVMAARREPIISFADAFANALKHSGTLYGGFFLPDQENEFFFPINVNVGEDGNIQFTTPIAEGSPVTNYFALLTTIYNPTGQATMGISSLEQKGNDVSYDTQNEGATTEVTLIESLYWAIESDKEFKAYLQEEYDLTDPSTLSTALPNSPSFTEEYAIQPEKLQGMLAFVEAAFQEMNNAGITTTEIAAISGLSFTKNGAISVPHFQMATPLNYSDEIIAASALPGLSTALDMYNDLTSLSASFGNMTLAEIENQMSSALSGDPVGLDYGSGTIGSALPYLDEFTYRYGSGPDYDAMLTTVGNDMGSLKELSVDAFLSNAKLTRENLSSTTQTLLLKIKNAQANLEGAIDLLDSTFEDVKNAMRDLFAAW